MSSTDQQTDQELGPSLEARLRRAGEQLDRAAARYEHFPSQAPARAQRAERRLRAGIVGLTVGVAASLAGFVIVQTKQQKQTTVTLAAIEGETSVAGTSIPNASTPPNAATQTIPGPTTEPTTVPLPDSYTLDAASPGVLIMFKPSETSSTIHTGGASKSFGYFKTRRPNQQLTVHSVSPAGSVLKVVVRLRANTAQVTTPTIPANPVSSVAAKSSPKGTDAQGASDVLIGSIRVPAKSQSLTLPDVGVYNIEVSGAKEDVSFTLEIL